MDGMETSSDPSRAGPNKRPAPPTRAGGVKTLVLLHPFLYALFPPLALLAMNSGQVSPGVVVRPLAVSLLASAVLFAAWRVLLRSRPKAAAATSVCVTAFFAYGHVYLSL